MKWEPIETAPKDKTVDLWILEDEGTKRRRLVNCRWIEEIPDTKESNGMRGGWYAGCFHGGGQDFTAYDPIYKMTDNGVPTHWMLVETP